MASIVITGGTGLVGSALTPLLVAKGHEVTILSRKQHSSNDPSVRYASWDVVAQSIDSEAIARADYIVHLAGAGVAEKRWTAKRKREILESRTKGSSLIVKALKETPNTVKAVISASGIGWYGSDARRKLSNKPFTEIAPPDEGFLGETCRLWEESISPVMALGKRLVILRTGIALSNENGALPEFEKPFKFGIAAVLGSGKQVVSWIHIDDLCRLYMYAIDHAELSGVYNAVAPAPATNKELTIELAERIRGRFYVPVHVPAFLLQMVLGGMSEEVLKSATVSAEKIRSAGFQFLYPSLNAALDELTTGNRPAAH